MKRKTAVCKCGRTVRVNSFISEWKDPNLGPQTDGWRYYIWCPCGVTTDEYHIPNQAWAEWKRLQEANDGK